MSDPTRDIELQWQRIEAWLEANAPRILARLQPGANDAQIADAERVLEVRLPDAVRASYRRHNGYQDAYGMAASNLIPLAEIVEQWQVWKELLDAGDFADDVTEPEPGIRPDWWNARWIPLTYDGAGNHASLDLDPAPDGQVGQIIAMWHDASDRPLLAPGFTAWLQKMADDLEAETLAYSAEYDTIMPADEIGETSETNS